MEINAGFDSLKDFFFLFTLKANFKVDCQSQSDPWKEAMENIHTVIANQTACVGLVYKKKPGSNMTLVCFAFGHPYSGRI